MLKAKGVYAFYPSREKRYKAQGRTIRRELPEISGYVFAQFRFEPRWHVLKERRRQILGVLTRGGVPIVFHRDIMRHLQGLTVEARKLEEAKREMNRIREGDKAQIIDGPLAGFMVDVEELDGVEAVVNQLLGKRGRVNVSSLRRVVD